MKTTQQEKILQLCISVAVLYVAIQIIFFISILDNFKEIRPMIHLFIILIISYFLLVKMFPKRDSPLKNLILGITVEILFVYISFLLSIILQLLIFHYAERFSSLLLIGGLILLNVLTLALLTLFSKFINNNYLTTKKMILEKFNIVNLVTTISVLYAVVIFANDTFEKTKINITTSSENEMKKLALCLSNIFNDEYSNDDEIRYRNYCNLDQSIINDIVDRQEYTITVTQNINNNSNSIERTFKFQNNENISSKIKIFALINGYLIFVLLYSVIIKAIPLISNRK